MRAHTRPAHLAAVGLRRRLLSAVLCAVVAAAVAPAAASAGYNSWSRVGSSSMKLRQLTLSPTFAADKTAFAAWSTEDWGGAGGLARSTDGGRTWTKIGASGPIVWVKSIALSPTYSTDKTIFVGCEGVGGSVTPKAPAVIWRSTDGGSTWKKVSSSLSEQAAVVAVSPDFAADHRVIASTASAVLLSTDVGDSWLRPHNGAAEKYGPALALQAGGLLAVAGTNGKLSTVRSADNGRSWLDGSALTLPAGTAEPAVAALDEAGSTLFMLTESDAVLKSTDGGARWTTVASPATDFDDQWMRAIDFCDASNGIAVGWTRPGHTGVAYTSDGGATWRDSTLPALGDYGLSLNDVEFLDARHAWAVGSNGGPLVLFSADGGASWQAQPLPAEHEGNPFDGWTGWMQEVDFVDANVGWALGESLYAGKVVLRTANGGATWSIVKAFPLEEGPGEIQSLVALSAQHAVFSVSNGMSSDAASAVYATFDGGATFTETSFSPDWTIPSSLAFANENEGVVTGDEGLLASTSDGGRTWTRTAKGLPSPALALAFSPTYASEPLVIARSIEETNGDSIVATFASRDHGMSWSRLPLSGGAPDDCWVAISPGFSADRTIYASGTGGTYRSTDGGASWTRFSSSSSRLFLSPGFATDGTMFRIAKATPKPWTYSSLMQMFVSTNRGTSWTAVGNPWDFRGAEGVCPVPDYPSNRMVYALRDTHPISLTIGPPKSAKLAATAGVGRWDKRWVGWSLRTQMKIYPSHPEGWTKVSLVFEKKVNGKWTRYTRVYPFKIDYKGTAKPLASTYLYPNSILAGESWDYDWIDYVFRSKGSYRVRGVHSDAGKLAGHTTSYSNWAYFTIK